MPQLRTLRLTLALSAAFAGSVQAQDLLAMVQLAQQHDSAWQAAQAQLVAAERRADQAQAGLLPSVGLSAGLSHNNTDVSRPPVDYSGQTRSAAISATQPLYRPANRIGYEQGQRGADLAQAQLDAAAQDLLIRVSQAYFDVLGAEDALSFVQAQKAAVSEQRAAAQRNFEVGTATITDTHEAQARYDLVTAQEIAAQNDLRVKRLALDQLVGRQGSKPDHLAQPLALPGVQPDDVETWVQTALQQQPGVRQAQLALEVARLETRKAEAGHKPTVDLQASYAVQHNPNGTVTVPNINGRTHSTTVGVALNLPLFAGFAVQNRVKETLALEDKAEADLETARRNVAQATRSAFFGVQSGAGQVKALEAAEASSQSALDANLLGYKVGVRVNIDVLNAQSQLYQTKRDLAQARYNLLLGQLKLRQAAGTLSIDDVQNLNALLAR
jgi:outer membrane protein